MLDTIPKILIIGLGGIGSNLVELVVPVLKRCEVAAEIHLMDSDDVESNNLGHQRFTVTDIDYPKVKVLSERYDQVESSVRIIAHEEDLRDSSQLQGWDIVVVSVDRPLPRLLVHASGVPWLDLRCMDGGLMALTYEESEQLVRTMTPDHEPKGCVSKEAFEAGNIQFGFAAAAAYGAEWLFQCLRRISGEDVHLPQGTIFYFAGGTMEFPQVEVVA